MSSRPVIFVFLFCLLAIPSLSVTLQGRIYDVELNELSNVVIEINSTPWQRFVSKDGSYEFNLPPGTYELTAKYANGGLNILTSEDEVTVPEGSGEFVFDIFLLGDLDDELELLEPSEDSDLDVGDFIPVERDDIGVTAVVTAFIILASVLIYAYYWRRKKEKEELKEINKGLQQAKQLAKEHPPDEKVKEVLRAMEDKERLEKEDKLASDTEIILEILKKEGGRATQKEIRKHIPLSEAKISLMIAELEHQKKVKKVKKGRGNIIILND